MTDQPRNKDEEAQEKQRAHFERARKSVLQFLKDKGGKLSMAEMHDYSLMKFLIQHQAFSRMMETFVSEGLVEFDNDTYAVTLTEEGYKFINP